MIIATRSANSSRLTISREMPVLRTGRFRLDTEAAPILAVLLRYATPVATQTDVPAVLPSSGRARPEVIRFPKERGDT
jgi:hypothetical protein